MKDSDKTVWVVEDEDRISEVLCAYLQQAGYSAVRFADGEGVVERAKEEAPDLILLDLMLPGTDGMSLCREIRGFSQVPIIMVTARTEEVDRLLGLELGADDYICKPFSPREAVARVKAVLRRTAATPMPARRASSEPLRCGRFLIDVDRFSATLEGRELGLTPKEFKMLTAFVSQPRRVFSREQLMDRMYLQEEFFSDRMIDSHLKNLRKKIAAINPTLDCIQTVYGVGYRFVADATRPYED